MEVSCYDLLADHEVRNVYLKTVRKVVYQSADTELAAGYQKLSAELDTFRVSCDDDRNIDNDRLVFRNGEEVYVESFVCYRMPLYFMENSLEFLAVIEFEIDNI